MRTTTSDSRQLHCQIPTSAILYDFASISAVESKKQEREEKGEKEEKTERETEDEYFCRTDRLILV